MCRHVPRFLPVLGALVLLVACGGSPSQTGDSGTDAAPPRGDASEGRAFEELCFQPDLYCERLYACATPERLAQDQTFFGHDDQASCVTQQDMFVGAICRQLGRSIDAGRLAVDLESATACADYMEALPCERFVHDPPSAHPLCEASPFVTPLVAPGGACEADIECQVPDSVCTATFGSEGGSEGVCREAPGEGEACVNERCASGLECVEDVCAPVHAGGCHYDHDCDDGMWCDQPGVDFRVEFERPELRGACVLQLPLDAECEDLQACDEGLYCDDVNGQDADGFRLPGACAAPRPSGAACNEPADCLSFECSLSSSTCS